MSSGGRVRSSPRRQAAPVPRQSVAQVPMVMAAPGGQQYQWVQVIPSTGFPRMGGRQAAQFVMSPMAVTAPQGRQGRRGGQVC